MKTHQFIVTKIYDLTTDEVICVISRYIEYMEARKTGSSKIFYDYSFLYGDSCKQIIANFIRDYCHIGVSPSEKHLELSEKIYRILF